MDKIKLLDCTLRDGGYYTKWDFSDDLVEIYLNACNALPIDYIEVGYRSLPSSEYFGEFFYCPEYLLSKIRKTFKKKIAIMLNEKDVQIKDAEELLFDKNKYIDLVRLAVDPENFFRAIGLAKHIKQMGFEVGFNLMYMSKWAGQPELTKQFHELNEAADYFYMVDSYGGIYPEEVAEICKIVKDRVEIPYGFHGHNNLEMALINSLTAVENGATLLDATITGMGRGAGNLKTELLLAAMHAKGIMEIDFNVLGDLTHAFEELQSIHKWGTNLPYMVSGANSLPQKDVMEWVSKRFYSYNSIIRALHNQKAKREDNESFKVFSLPKGSNPTVLLVGGGPSVAERSNAISTFLLKNPKIIVVHASSRNAGNFKGVANEQYFCLVGNEGNRLEKVFEDLGHFKGTCLLPAFPRKMGTYVPPAVVDMTFELKSVDFTEKLQDTHTAIALQTLIELSATKVYVVGYDGYANALIGNRELELFNENEILFSKYIGHSGVELKTLTPSLYKTLNADSLYANI